jgi:ABC-type branched-subunit amino acid transport system substrate-binding protein
MLATTIGCTSSGDPTAENQKGARTAAAIDGTPTVIKLGALDDPGTTPLYGNAIRLAVNQMNQALTAIHSNVQFSVAFGDDHGNNPAIAKSETLRLLNDEHVLAMVSDSSGDTIQVNRLNYDPATAAPYKFPAVCYQCSSGFINDPNATDPDPITQAALRDGDNWLRRICYNANFEAKVIDQIILAKPNVGDRNGDGVLKLSIYADGGHVSLANALGPTLALYTGQPTSVEIIFLSNQANMPAEWARVVDNFNESTKQMDGEPDYVVMAMLPVNVTAAVQSYRAGGFTLPIVSNNSFRRNYILPLVGPGANGLEGSSVALANSDVAGQLFVNAFTAAYGTGPEQTSSGAYDSVTTLMLASLVAAQACHDPAQVTPGGIRAALDTINDPHGVPIVPAVASFAVAGVLAKLGVPMNYDGAYNNDDWNAVGDIFPPLVHWTVENNAFVEHESYLCDPANPLCPVQ